MAIPKLEDCNPGARAVGFTLIIATEPVESKTAGGIILPDATVDKNTVVQTRGRIISQGSVAWDFAKFPEGTKPKVGDAVMFAKVTGTSFKGVDGLTYRILHDEAINAIIEEDAA